MPEASQDLPWEKEVASFFKSKEEKRGQEKHLEENIICIVRETWGWKKEQGQEARAADLCQIPRCTSGLEMGPLRPGVRCL